MVIIWGYHRSPLFSTVVPAFRFKSSPHALAHGFSCGLYTSIGQPFGGGMKHHKNGLKTNLRLFRNTNDGKLFFNFPAPY
jgi:hypothetical protein